ncbi:hypothetical protein Peur_038973 [Populus x canadensis]
MDRVRAVSGTDPDCPGFISYAVKNVAGKVISIGLAFVFSNLLHQLLKPLSQPRIVSDIVVGLVLGNIGVIRQAFDEQFIAILNSTFGMMCYMFVLGMEMDPYVILKGPTRNALVAYAGMVSTSVLVCCIIPFMNYYKHPSIGFTLSLSISLSGSASHILTRLITSLKIGKSDIGKIVIAAGVHSDMISMLLISIGYHFLQLTITVTDIAASVRMTLIMAAALLLQILFTATVSPIFMNWVNNENPEGKPMKVITIFGKVVGTIICGAMLGFHRRESAELGFLITAKGHFHVFLAVVASLLGITTISTCISIIIVIFLSVVHTPTVVSKIIKRARKLAPTQRMALQWLDPSNQIASTLVQEGRDTVTATDKDVTQMRDQITTAVQAYVEENGDGITLKRMLALSKFNGMAKDICNLAEDLMISLVILPFHKNQYANGTLDGGNPGFRHVNRKVLRNAPCSVGILVDRGYGLVEEISRPVRSFQVAVIFFGGKDDREALAYAGRVARHPGVKLTVIRFLLDSDSENASRRAGNYRKNAAGQEEEMKLDDECFAQFYERHIAGGHVSYNEKHVANSAETYATLRSLEGQYGLIIVGRGGRVNSILTIGMNDWQQCPELGPIGDVLSGSDSSHTTSVLIIQQHSLKGELDGVDDEFSIM